MQNADEIRTKVKSFWSKLAQQLTKESVKGANKDTKLPNHDNNEPPVVILPYGSSQKEYYADGEIKVQILPELSKIDDRAIFELSRQPGILALAFDGKKNLPLKYVVPGGRFNEFYGWDSYFIARGLLNDGYIDLAADVADHFAYEIRNYGKILNANRPYYLGRSQPPFLTDLAFRLLRAKCADFEDKFVDWINAAILEHEQVWQSAPRYDTDTNLFKYSAQGRGIPPEVEEGHFDRVLEPIAKKHGLSLKDFVDKYNANEVNDHELDVFLMHDRAIRESGHDVTSRFVNVCADLVTIDLCALLYKYETDIADAIHQFPTRFVQSETKWRDRALLTKQMANKYLWHEEGDGGYFCDYNVRLGSQHYPVLCPTTLYSLWSGLASKEQAEKIVRTALPCLEFDGGLASTSKLQVGNHDSRQWDYPAGWAPHQILAWEGLHKYGYTQHASRIATKWLKTLCQGARQSQGALFEKYDVTGVPNPQDVRAEYGNQGSNETGFGWTNASFAIALDHFYKPRV